MPSNEVHSARLFADAGYTMGIVGKNHCFTEEQLAAFETFEEDPYQAIVHEQPGRRAKLDVAREFVKNHHRQFVDVTACGVNPAEPDDYPTMLIAERAVRLLERNRSDPFLLWVSFPDPHAPYQVPEP